MAYIIDTIYHEYQKLEFVSYRMDGLWRNLTKYWLVHALNEIYSTFSLMYS